MGLNLNRFSAQEAANISANPLVLSKTINFDGTGNNGKILAAATLSTALTGANNDIDYTAATQGLAGNLITIAYVDPGTQGASLSVSVTGNAITVNLATDSAAKATGTLTSTGTAPANNDTVTVGSKTYTYKTTLTGAANEVLIGASAAIALDNLKAAVNGAAGEGTLYGTGTVASSEVDATTNTDTTQVFEAALAGTAGNSIATTEVSSQLSFGGATLSGGLAGGSITSTGDDIKTAIAGSAPANALVSTADKAGNDGSGVVTAMAATALAGGSDGYIDLFTLDEDFNVVVWGSCREDLVGATATISVGVTGATTALLGSQTATNIDNTEAWDTTGIIAAGTKPNASPFYFLQEGLVIRAYVGTASITDGKITFYAVLGRPTDNPSVSISGSITPGTGAANLGKAEDAVHASGDTGVLSLAVRDDSPAANSGTDGDYESLHVNAEGGLWTSGTPSASGGLSIFRSLDLDESEEEVKATAGSVYGMWVTNTATSTRWIKFYNATAANVTVGTTTPVLTWGISGNSSDDISGLLSNGAVGIKFDTAICVAATTGVADNDTGAPAANDVIVNIFYK